MHTAQRLKHVVTGRWFLRLAGALIALTLMTSVALAASTVSGTFNGRDAARSMEINLIRPGETGLYHDFAGVLRLRTASGQNLDVFCMQLFVAAINGRTYNSDGPVTSVQNGCFVRALLAKHPASSATTALEGAAIQTAIWHFTDGLNLDTIYPRGQPTVTTLRDRAKALVAEAEADVAAGGGCVAIGPRVESITISPASATGTTGQPIAYTVTVVPANAASTVTVSVNGTALLDNGQQSISLPLANGSAAFNVSSPDGTPATISASVPDTLDAGTLFNDPRGGQQVVLGTAFSASASTQAQAAWQAGPTPTNTETATATATATTVVNTATPTATTVSNTATPTATTTGSTATATATTTGSTATATATTVSNTATPTSITVITATRTPGGGPEPSATPTTTGEQTATPEVTSTATQVIPSSETATATPASIDPTSGPAGGAAPVVPRSLPNTGETPANTNGWWLIVAVLLASTGLALRRRSAR